MQICDSGYIHNIDSLGLIGLIFRSVLLLCKEDDYGEGAFTLGENTCVIQFLFGL